MELLEKKDYYKLIEPLQKVTFNCLFAYAVIEQKVAGKVYVDNMNNPQTYYIVHPYGLSLLFGDNNNIDFNQKFLDYSLNVNQVRKNYEWLHAYPSDWDNVLFKLYGDKLIQSSENTKNKGKKIELHTRINFQFSYQKHQKYKINNLSILAPNLQIVRTDESIIKNIKGSVIPTHYWNNEQDFFNDGVGFSILYKNKPVSTAFSAYIKDNKLGIGIETAEKFRKRGFAERVCSALINYCIENEFEPVWSCRIENIGSYELAKKIGFVPIFNTPCYRLCL